LITIRQSLPGKLGIVLVSSKCNRTTRCFNLRVSSPNDSPLSQSSPAQTRPVTIRSSLMCWSLAMTGSAAGGEQGEGPECGHEAEAEGAYHGGKLAKIAGKSVTTPPPNP
jgi:hypothetical protein